jgi:hypothetical protein
MVLAKYYRKTVWLIASFLWLLGWGVYSVGKNSDLMQPPVVSVTKNDSISKVDSEMALYKHYPEFNALMYSLDVFLPIVDLHQESYWSPSPPIEKGKKTYTLNYFILIFWMRFQILTGWILTTMLVGGLTGLIRNK